MYNPQKTDLQKIKNNFSRTNIFFVATSRDKIVGVVRGRKDRIINLFVDEKHHNKGIARKLIKRFEQECIKKKTSEIKINSSLYAVSFYQKVGYKKTTGIRNFHGLKISPMRKIFR